MTIRSESLLLGDIEDCVGRVALARERLDLGDACLLGLALSGLEHALAHLRAG